MPCGDRNLTGEPEAARRPAGAWALRAAELALPLGFLAATFAVAPGTPLAVPISPAIHLVGLAALLVVLLRLERLSPAWDGWLAVAIGVAAEQCLVLTPGVPLGHDVGPHLWGSAAIADALRDGSSPLWLHRLGAGVPLLQFYPPLGFVPIVAMHLAGLPLHAAFRFAFVLFSAVGSLGVQRAVREWTGDRRAALVAAAAFAFAPYRLFDAHIRTALGETAALAVLPFLCLAFQRVLARRGGGPLLAVSGAVLALAHLLSVVLAAYGLLVWWIAYMAGLGRAAWQRALATLRPLLAAAGGALALSAFFLCPLLADLGATSLSRTVPNGGWLAPGLRPLDWLGAPREPLPPARPRPAPPAASAGPASASEPAPPARAPITFGGALLAGLLLLLVQIVVEGVRRAERPPTGEAPDLQALRLGVLAAGLFGLVFSLEASTGWNVYLPLVRVLQFSWRGLGLATVAASLGVGLVLAGANRRRGGKVLALLVLAVVWGEGWLHAGVLRWLQPWDDLAALAPTGLPGLATTAPVPHRHYRISGFVVPPSRPGTPLANGILEPFFEYTNPRAYEIGRTDKAQLGVSLLVRRNGLQVTLPGQPYAEWRLGERSRPLRARALGGRIVVHARKPGTILVREQCFPGWKQRTAAGWQPAACSPDGFLQTTVSEAGLVEWRFFAWRWPRVLGFAISALAVAGLLVIHLRNREV